MFNEYEDAEPIYITVDTEYFKSVDKTNKDVHEVFKDYENFKLVHKSLEKARTKHPHFCDTIAPCSVEYYAMLESNMKKLNDKYCESGISAEMILEEEVNEMYHAYKEGNKQKAKEECADCIAVLVRIMEELDK